MSTRRGCTNDCYYSTGAVTACTCACGGQYHGHGASDPTGFSAGTVAHVGGVAFIPGEPSDSIPAQAPAAGAETAAVDSQARVWQDTRMSAADDHTFERETDERLAALSYEQYRTLDRIDRLRTAVVSATNPPYYYRGSQHVTDRTFPEAKAMLTEALADYDAEHPDGGNEWDELKTLMDPKYRSAPNVQYARKLLIDLDTERATLDALNQQVAAENEKYSGWSRFHVVTSSPGHVHASTRCQTCYPTTRFGWMPWLSGQSEAEAVAALGANLCSVCFPTAPVEHQGGKLTAAQAQKIADGGLDAAREIMAKNKAAQADVCPGSGKGGIEPKRQGWTSGNFVTCPECKARVGGKGYTVRKHKRGGGR